MEDFWMFAVGAAGAMAGEVFRLHDLYERVPARRFRALISSHLYWAFAAAFVLSSGFIAWAINTGLDATMWQVVIAGLGARTIWAKSAQIAVSRGPSLGAKVTADDQERITVADVLG